MYFLVYATIRQFITLATFVSRKSNGVWLVDVVNVNIWHGADAPHIECDSLTNKPGLT